MRADSLRQRPAAAQGMEAHQRKRNLLPGWSRAAPVQGTRRLRPRLVPSPRQREIPAYRNARFSCLPHILCLTRSVPAAEEVEGVVREEEGEVEVDEVGVEERVVVEQAVEEREVVERAAEAAEAREEPAGPAVEREEGKADPEVQGVRVAVAEEGVAQVGPRGRRGRISIRIM